MPKTIQAKRTTDQRID